LAPFALYVSWFDCPASQIGRIISHANRAHASLESACFWTQSWQHKRNNSSLNLITTVLLSNVADDKKRKSQLKASCPAQQAAPGRKTRG
jgi:hypothetical protein